MVIVPKISVQCAVRSHVARHKLRITRIRKGAARTLQAETDKGTAESDDGVVSEDVRDVLENLISLLERGDADDLAGPEQAATAAATWAAPEDDIAAVVEALVCTLDADEAAAQANDMWLLLCVS